jgi:glycosyltransferase involved in cell wall biosynthesis
VEAHVPDVTVITASVPRRASLLGDAVLSVAAQTAPVAHLIGVDASRGVAEVRNSLIEAAQTEWVAFLDDDDLLDYDHIATLWKHRHDSDVVIPHCRFDGPPLPAGYCNRPYDREVLAEHGIFPITVLARRRAILDIGGFPTEGWDDWLLWNAMADNGARFVVVPQETWTYRTSTTDRRTHTLQGA